MLDRLLILASESGGAAATGAASDDASVYSRIGWAVAIIVIIGFAVAAFIAMRRGRPEVGSEIELAPNRKPYLSDEELEGTKLDRTLTAGLLLLAVIGVTLPLYWLYEPARQEGAVEARREEAIRRGEEVYVTKAQCVNCHGPKGVGGVAETSLLNESGQYVSTVKWQAPALDTVLYRYSRAEVMDILNYGRGNTPMPAWGAPGGGPLTEQQLQRVIDYLESIQLPAAEARKQLLAEIEKVCKPDDKGICTVKRDPAAPANAAIPGYETVGDALFNLGLWDGYAGGAASCGRCHTKGWSYGKPEVSGGGFLGPNLTGGSELRQFESPQTQIDFVSKGSERGKRYGRGGNGSGQMPGYGYNPNAEIENPVMHTDQVMYSQEQIAAVVAYERGL